MRAPIDQITVMQLIDCSLPNLFMPLALDLNRKLKVTAGEREIHSFGFGHVCLCELPDTELLQLSTDEHGKAVSAGVLSVGHTVVAPEHAYPVKVITQQFLLNNGKLIEHQRPEIDHVCRRPLTEQSTQSPWLKGSKIFLCTLLTLFGRHM
ncbi:hypothetical protein D3C76_1396380 [compost metagenome]